MKTFDLNQQNLQHKITAPHGNHQQTNYKRNNIKKSGK